MVNPIFVRKYSLENLVEEVSQVSGGDEFADPPPEMDGDENPIGNGSDSHEAIARFRDAVEDEETVLVTDEGTKEVEVDREASLETIENTLREYSEERIIDWFRRSGVKSKHLAALQEKLIETDQALTQVSNEKNEVKDLYSYISGNQTLIRYPVQNGRVQKNLREGFREEAQSLDTVTSILKNYTKEMKNAISSGEIKMTPAVRNTSQSRVLSSRFMGGLTPKAKKDGIVHRTADGDLGVGRRSGSEDNSVKEALYAVAAYIPVVGKLTEAWRSASDVNAMNRQNRFTGAQFKEAFSPIMNKMDEAMKALSEFTAILDDYDDKVKGKEARRVQAEAQGYAILIEDVIRSNTKFALAVTKRIS